MSHPVDPGPLDEEPMDRDFDPGLDQDVLQRRRELALTFLALLLITITSLAVARKMLVVSRTQLAAVWDVARDAIREQAPAGFAVHFGGTQSGEDKPEIVPLSEDTYQVTGRVANISPSGRAVFFFYRCLVRRDQAGRVRPEKLELTPAEY